MTNKQPRNLHHEGARSKAKKPEKSKQKNAPRAPPNQRELAIEYTELTVTELTRRRRVTRSSKERRQNVSLEIQITNEIL